MRALAVVALAACGRVGFDAHGRDGGGDGNATDGPDGAAVCQTWSAFTPVLDNTLSTGGSDDWLPRISTDGLTLLLDSYNGADFDIAISNRAATTDPFPAPTLLGGASGVGDEQDGQLSADRDRLYLFLYNASYELWQFTRSGAAYAPGFRHVQQTNIQHFWISGDEMRVYSIRFSGSTGTVLMAQRTDLAMQFDAGTPVLTVPGTGSMSLALSEDELEMMVAAPVTGPGDDLDLFFTSRTSKTAMFGALVPIPELSGAMDDCVGSWSSDKSTAYVNINTNVNGGGDADVYIATRTCLD